MSARTARCWSSSRLEPPICLTSPAPSAGSRKDRTVAAWTVTAGTVAKRDVVYQRYFPLPPDPDGTLVNRGHLIPHLSSGEFGPNIFRQHRPLNRGWSEQ